MITQKEQLYKILDDMNIHYQSFSHPPTHHFEELREIRDKIEGLHCKCLFLTDKNSFYMVLMRGELRLDLKSLQNSLGCRRLSFGKGEDMEAILHVSPGSCTPFALINDKNKKINKVICDSAFKEAEYINFHPIENNATVQVRPKDFFKWLSHCGHDYIFHDFDSMV